MAYSELPDSAIEVGKAIKKEIFKKLNDNVKDHEERISALALGASPVEICEANVDLRSGSVGSGDVFTYKAKSYFILSQAQLQIFERSPNTSGSLTVDILKSATLDGAFTTMLTTPITIDYALVLDFASLDGVFDGVPEVLSGEYIKVRVLASPTKYPVKFRVGIHGAIA